MCNNGTHLFFARGGESITRGQFASGRKLPLFPLVNMAHSVNKILLVAYYKLSYGLQYDIHQYIFMCIFKFYGQIYILSYRTEDSIARGPLSIS